MQYFTILAFAATTLALPSMIERQAPLCSSGNPLCCATDVLNLANLDCAVPPIFPANVNEFINTCAEKGQQAKCCLLPILEQGLLCSDVNPAPAAPADPAAIGTA